MAETYPIISGTQLREYLEHKGIAQQCPVCQQGEMTFPVNDPDGTLGGAAPAVRVQEVLAGQPALGYGQFAQVCSHCAYLRYFRDFEVFEFFAEKSDDNGE